MKEHEKLCQKPVSKVTLHFVWGHLTRKQTVVCGPLEVRQEGSALQPQEQEGETKVVHGRRQGMPTSTNLFLVCKTGFFSPIFEHHEQMDMTDP